MTIPATFCSDCWVSLNGAKSMYAKANPQTSSIPIHSSSSADSPTSSTYLLTYLPHGVASNPPTPLCFSPTLAIAQGTAFPRIPQGLCFPEEQMSLPHDSNAWLVLYFKCSLGTSGSDCIERNADSSRCCLRRW